MRNACINRYDQIHQTDQGGRIVKVLLFVAKRLDLTNILKDSPLFRREFLLQTYPLYVKT